MKKILLLLLGLFLCLNSAWADGIYGQGIVGPEKGGVAVISLKAYGLPTGGDDTVAINKALTDAKAAGQAVYAPCGVYKHGNMITVDSVRFYGDGITCTKFIATDNAGASGSAIKLIGTNPEVYGIWHNAAYSAGRSASPNLASFWISDATGALLHDTRTDGVWGETGIHTRGLTGGKVYNNYVTGSLSNAMFTRGTSNMGATKSEFYGNYVVGGGDTCMEFTSYNGANNVSDGTIINSKLDIHDNYVENCLYHGISVVGGEYEDVHDNRIFNAGADGIYIATELNGGYSTFYASHINVHDNIIYGAAATSAGAYSLLVYGGNHPTNPVSDVSIKNNTIYTNSANDSGSIRIGACDTCSSSDIGVKNVDVEGNKVYGNGTYGASIQVRGADTVSVRSNLVSGSQSQGFYTCCGNSGTLTVTDNTFTNLNLAGTAAANGAIYLQNSGFTHHIISGNKYKAGANAINNLLVCQNTSVADIWVNNNQGDTTSIGTCIVRQGVYTTQVNTQSASYTLAYADFSNFVQMNCGSACNLTVPPNSSVAFPIGTQVCFDQYGAGAVTLVAGSGVTLRSYSTLVMNGQYAAGCVLKIASDTWQVVGSFQ